MDAKTLNRAAALVETNPEAAYDLVLGNAAEIAQNDPGTAFDLVLARGREVPMGAWDGKEYHWPQLPEFEFFSDRVDALRDTYEATYQYTGGRDLNLFITMKSSPYSDTGGRKPGLFEARYHGQVEKGSWRNIKDIPQVLRALVKKAEGARADVKKALKNVGGPLWEVTYDWGQLVANYQNPNRYSDATMDVTFEDVDDVIFGEDPAGEAVISYAAGADYEGSYGQQEERDTYRNLDNIETVLKKAERLWKRWIKPS